MRRDQKSSQQEKRFQRNRIKPGVFGAAAVFLLLFLPARPIEAAMPATQAESAGAEELTGEVGEFLSGFELGEAEQEYLKQIGERLASGELDSEEAILEEIESAEKEFDFSLTEKQKETIVSLGLKLQKLGLNSEEIAAAAEKVLEKYGDRIKESAGEAIQENIVEPAKEAVKEGTKSAVKHFFGEMKRSLVGFWEKLTQ